MLAQKPAEDESPVPLAVMVSGVCGSSLTREKTAERLPLPVGANWMVMSDSAPGAMAIGNVGAGESEKSLLPLARVMAETLRGAVPTLKSCTGTLRLAPVATLPNPTVVMGLVEYLAR